MAPGSATCHFGDSCKFCHSQPGETCNLARRKSAREKRKQRLHPLFDYWSKKGIPAFIEALLKNAPPPEEEEPDESWKMLDKLNQIFISKQQLEADLKQGSENA